MSTWIRRQDALVAKGEELTTGFPDGINKWAWPVFYLKIVILFIGYIALIAGLCILWWPVWFPPGSTG